jgi:hypothetical protein
LATLAKLKQKRAARREGYVKKARKNEADSKYRRKKAHAARMERVAKRAKAKAEKSTKAAEKSSKAEEKTTKAALNKDAAIKSCSYGQCLKGKGIHAKCVKTGGKYHLDQVDFVHCTTKKPSDMMGNWAGTPFKNSDFPETQFKDPGFSMPTMPTRL